LEFSSRIISAIDDESGVFSVIFFIREADGGGEGTPVVNVKDISKIGRLLFVLGS
jgi:hypothetical protein